MSFTCCKFNYLICYYNHIQDNGKIPKLCEKDSLAILQLLFDHSVFLCVCIISSKRQSASFIAEIQHICYDDPIVCPQMHAKSDMNYGVTIFTHRHRDWCCLSWMIHYVMSMVGPLENPMMQDQV